jgi:membrane-bound lytic murein transglycosylase B
MGSATKPTPGFATIYALIVWRGLIIAAGARDTCSRLLAGALSLSFFVYFFVNIGIVSGLLPVVGVPLPLVSYGGTSMVTLMAALGMLMSMLLTWTLRGVLTKMNISFPIFTNVLCCGLFVAMSAAGDVPTAVQARSAGYLARPAVHEFIARLVSQHGFNKVELERLFANAKQQESALEAIARPAEAKPWHEYREIFVTPQRIQSGVEFWIENQDLLEAAERFFGVPAEIIVAIIGVETYYGRQTGDFPVFDTLITLGFDYPPRSDFFREELEHFLLLSREESLHIPAAEGSYAGAMGMGQFISSSYRRFAVDFDGDGKRDLWDSSADAIGSVANYLRVHGWNTGAPVVVQASVRGTDYQSLLDKGLEPTIQADLLAARGVKTQGPLDDNAHVALFAYDAGDGMQYWVGLDNFYVITHYNQSSLYAMAVYQLSQAIKQARDTRLANTQ